MVATGRPLPLQVSYFECSILQWGPGPGTMELNCRPPKVGWCTEPSPVWLMPPTDALAPRGWCRWRSARDGCFLGEGGGCVSQPHPHRRDPSHPSARHPPSARHRFLGSLYASAAARSKHPKPVHTVPTLERGGRAWIMDRGGSVASEFKPLPIFPLDPFH